MTEPDNVYQDYVYNNCYMVQKLSTERGLEISIQDIHFTA